MILAFSLLCFYYIFSELIQIYMERQWKTFYIYSLMLLTAWCLNLLMALNVKIPSPAVFISKMTALIIG
jgi:hypothetical protein